MCYGCWDGYGRPTPSRSHDNQEDRLMEFNHKPEYSYIPDGLGTRRVTDIHKHEYWGQAFIEGECLFALFQRQNGRHVAICTYGDWHHLREGQECVFKHDQNLRAVVLKFVRILTRDPSPEDRLGGAKIPFWTLK